MMRGVTLSARHSLLVYFPNRAQKKKPHMDDTELAKPQGVGLRNGRGPFQL